MHDAVVVGYARTPIGKLGGTLSSLTAMDLGGHAIRAALARAHTAADAVDYVVMGHVLQAGQGQMTVRQASLAGGVGMRTPTESINKVCLSGATAVARARDLIRLGEASVVVAGGMESMSNAPFALKQARFGYRLGSGELLDLMMHDGLTCAIDQCAMGAATDRYQSTEASQSSPVMRITRQDQDEFAVASHERAAAAADTGAFAGELVSVDVTQRRTVTAVDTDEGVRRDATLDRLASLRPAFDATGTVTAGNASQISDGAAALIVTSRDWAERNGLEVLASIDAWGTVAGPDPSLHLQPANAIRHAAGKLGADPSGFDLYEINEAFASVAVASMRDLELAHDRVNVRGGAVALGHPIGCSGARILVTLIDALRQRGGGRGMAALCGGGGQGDAVAVTVG